MSNGFDEENDRAQSPLIGITLDSEDASASGYSKFPWYALRENYASVVVKAGGIPVILPHEPSLIGAYLELLTGSLLPAVILMLTQRCMAITKPTKR